MKKQTKTKPEIFPIEIVERKIYVIRDQKVMLDRDLAELYQVPTKALNQAVQRNRERFPMDFMFPLDKKETENWKSQIVTSNSGIKMGLRKNPYVFTEQGIAMLSSVLKSERAVTVNIAIMRTFVRLREILGTHKELAEKIMNMEKKYDKKFRIIFEVLDELLGPPPEPPKEPMGFRLEKK